MTTDKNKEEVNMCKCNLKDSQYFGIDPIQTNFHAKFTYLFLFLGPGAPVVVVDCCVLEEGEEDEAEAHHEVDVNGLDVRDARQGGPHARTDRRHRQHGGDSCMYAT